MNTINVPSPGAEYLYLQGSNCYKVNSRVTESFQPIGFVPRTAAHSIITARSREQTSAAVLSMIWEMQGSRSFLREYSQLSLTKLPVDSSSEISGNDQRLAALQVCHSDGKSITIVYSDLRKPGSNIQRPPELLSKTTLREKSARPIPTTHWGKSEDVLTESGPVKTPLPIERLLLFLGSYLSGDALGLLKMFAHNRHDLRSPGLQFGIVVAFCVALNFR